MDGKYRIKVGRSKDSGTVILARRIPSTHFTPEQVDARIEAARGEEDPATEGNGSVKNRENAASSGGAGTWSEPRQHIWREQNRGPFQELSG